jgi:hypothetical protein
MTEPKTQTGPNDKELHRYADGDLSPAELSTLMQQAALDPSVAARIGGVLEVGDLVREISAKASADFDADAMFARIEADLTTSSAEISTESLDTGSLGVSKRPALRVIDGGGQKVPAASVPSDVGRRRILGAVIGGLAVAAAAAIALSQWGNDAVEVADGDDIVAPAPDTTPEVDDIAVAEHQRTEVLEVDFGTNVGTIFAVEGSEGHRYAVVWLDDGGGAVAD